MTTPLSERLLRLAAPNPRLRVDKRPPLDMWVMAAKAMGLTPDVEAAKKRPALQVYSGIAGFPDSLQVAHRTDGRTAFKARATRDGKTYDFEGSSPKRPWLPSKHSLWPPRMDIHSYPGDGEEVQEFARALNESGDFPGFFVVATPKGLHVSVNSQEDNDLERMPTGEDEVNPRMQFVKESTSVLRKLLPTAKVVGGSYYLRFVVPIGILTPELESRVREALAYLESILRGFLGSAKVRTPRRVEVLTKEAFEHSLHWKLEDVHQGSSGSFDIQAYTTDCSSSTLKALRRKRYRTKEGRPNYVLRELVTELADSYKVKTNPQTQRVTLDRDQYPRVALELSFTRPPRSLQDFIHALVTTIDSLPFFDSEENE